MGMPSPESFRREGEFWTITFDGRTVRLRDSVGLRYLASLLARPGDEVLAAAIARTPPVDAERARQSVSIAVRRALRRIARELPPLGDQLNRSVRTGSACRYDPDPRAHVSWEL